MKTRCLYLLVTMILIAPVLSSAASWEFWPGGRETRDVLIDDDVIWTVGDYGLCRWDSADLSYTLIPELYLDGVSECLSIDSDGYGGFWIGCSEARLVHYDAETDKWNVYSHKFDKSFSDSRSSPKNISSVACDKSGAVWMSGGDEWLSSFDGVTWKGWKPCDAQIYSIYEIVIDNNDVKWFTINGQYHFYSFDGAVWRHHTPDVPGPSGCRDLSVAYDGSVWFCGVGMGPNGNDIWHIVGDHWMSIGNPSEFSASCCAVGVDGSVWVGSNEGLAVYRDGFWIRFSADEWADSTSVNDIKVVDDTVWIGTKNGLTRYDWRGLESVSIEGPAESEIVTIIEADDGSHWMGSPLVRFDGTTWHHTNIECTASTFDGSGNLWTGGYNLVQRYDTDGNVTVEYIPATSKDNKITGIVVDSDIVWVSNSSLVFKYEDGTWTRFVYNTSNGLAGFRVKGIAVDTNGVLWVATEQGVSRYDGVSWSKYTDADGLPSKDITAVAVDSQNRAWVGTAYGIACIDGDNVTSYDVYDGLVDNEVTCIETSPSGEVWVGSPRGITVFDGVSWRAMLSGRDFLGSRVLSMCFDRGGDVWVGTDVGVNRLCPGNIGKREHVESTDVESSLNAWPNPSNAGITLRYTLDATSDVRLDVYNLAGQRVTTLVSCIQVAGDHAIFWDGTGHRGDRVASGLYIARLSATGVSTSVKITVLR